MKSALGKKKPSTGTGTGTGTSTLVFAALMLAASSCTPDLPLPRGFDRDGNGKRDGNPSPTGPARIRISIPEIAQIENRSDQPINGFHLTLKPKKQDCASTPEYEETQKWDGLAMTRFVDPNCNWLLGLEVGMQKSGAAENVALEKVFFRSFSPIDKKLVEIPGEFLKAGHESRIFVRLNIAKDGVDAGYQVPFVNSGASEVETFIETPKLIDPNLPIEGESPNPSDSNDPGTGGNGTDPSGQTGPSDGDDSTRPPVTPPSGGSSELKLYKAKKRKGVSKPVTWLHESHPLTIRHHGRTKGKVSDYADLWLVKVINPVFEKLSKAPYNIRAVSHMGIYNYRKIGGSSKLSRHSHGLAIDLSGFTTASGEKLTVKHNWKTSSLLKRIRNLFCQHFDVVLSPDYNRAHHDHFHVDLNPKYRSSEPAAPRWEDVPSSLALTFAQVPGGDDVDLDSQASVDAGHEFGHGVVEGDGPSMEDLGGLNLLRRSTCK